MLLQVYADLYDSDLDDIARKMDAAFPHFSPTSAQETGGIEGNTGEQNP